MNKKAQSQGGSIATTEIVYWVIALVILVGLFYFIGTSLAPLIMNWVSGFSEPEPEHILIDYGDTLHTQGEACEIVAQISGKRLNWGITQVLTSADDRAFLVKRNGILTLVPDTKITFVKDHLRLECDGEVLGYFIRQRLTLYTNSYLSGSKALKCFSKEELEKIDGAELNQGNTLCKYASSVSSAEKTSQVSRLTAYVSEKKIMYSEGNVYRDTKLYFDSLPLVEGGAEGKVIYLSEWRFDSRVGVVKNNRLEFFGEMSNTYIAVLNNHEIKLVNFNTQKDGKTEQGWLIY